MPKNIINNSVLPPYKIMLSNISFFLSKKKPLQSLKRLHFLDFSKKKSSAMLNLFFKIFAVKLLRTTRNSQLATHLIFLIIKSVTILGFALPFASFITSPINKPINFFFPFFKSSNLSGYFAITSFNIFSIKSSLES